MRVQGVFTPECSTLADGRAQHVFTKVDGEFRCTNCGQVSVPGQRWEQPKAVSA